MTIFKSQNGWPVLHSDSRLLHVWVIPAKTGEFKLRLRNGSAGFLLALFALWYAETIEKVAGRVLDDWGWAKMRYVRGSTDDITNHASGTAIDLNAIRHPLGRLTLKAWQKVKIRARLLLFAGCLRGGLDYAHRKDEMHYEINKPMASVERTARRLSHTKMGHRLLVANRGQYSVIHS